MGASAGPTRWSRYNPENSFKNFLSIWSVLFMVIEKAQAHWGQISGYCPNIKNLLKNCFLVMTQLGLVYGPWCRHSNAICLWAFGICSRRRFSEEFCYKEWLDGGDNRLSATLFGLTLGWAFTVGNLLCYILGSIWVYLNILDIWLRIQSGGELNIL